MTDNIEVIEMGIEASELLSEMHVSSFANLPEQVWSKNDFQEILSITGTKAQVICQSEIPFGFILLREMANEVEIITFCILPKWCNKGYATFLLEWVIKKLQLQITKRLFLEVRANNDAAIALYKKCSFKIIGRRKGYYNNHKSAKIDALVMQCDLIV
ncbi:MAG: GNAT family N-acetyltransferase [Kordiimonadaceae bacterium]|jgi:[ribosomal protein S18]-alanine N-acetyltransferase|nr:GNAT family N-acetyltransferase [Kordiimonadaceae bacterium]